jgi:hypothetical protein
MTSADLHGLRHHLSGLTLDESAFSAGDAVVNRVRDFGAAVTSLEAPSEPWLAEWLHAENVKGGMLYAAAKINWNHEQLGKGTAGDTRMRATIVNRFNSWVAQALERLSLYEMNPTSGTTRPWLAELDRFKIDPVRNP